MPDPNLEPDDDDVTELVLADELVASAEESLVREIEALFAKVDRASLREVTRQLGKLVVRVADPLARRRYEAALDVLPDMVKHGDERS